MASTKRADTKTALLNAAERLFAEKGLGAVSARDIMREAGARNESALHYHFGDMHALIVHLFAERFREIERSRLERMKVLRNRKRPPKLQDIMEAAMAPLIDACTTENGRLYAYFCEQLSTDPRFDVASIIRDYEMSSVTLVAQDLEGTLTKISESARRSRLRQTFKLSVMLMADYARQIEDGTAASAEDATRETAASMAGFLTAQA